MARRHEVHPNLIYARKKPLLENAARAFDAGMGLDATTTRSKVRARVVHVFGDQKNGMGAELGAPSASSARGAKSE